jgi:hypothetical protein
MSTSTSSGTTPAMRPALRWALAGSACAAAVMAWLPVEEADGDTTLVLTARGTPVAAAGAIAAAELASSRAGGQNMAVPVSIDPDAGAPWPPLSRAAQAAWVPAPPPRVALPASAALVAVVVAPPSFPYQWIGQMDDAGRLRVFLVDAQRLWAVSPGETVEPGWRFDGIDADGLKLTWLATGAVIQVAARP